MDEVDAFLADLRRWSADERARDAARSRTQERWLRRQAAEDARFTGLALDLAERKTEVAVRTTAGHTLHGRIEAVARDFCLLRHDADRATFVALAAIATVRPAGQRAAEADSERTVAVDTTLADVLGALAGDRPRVRVVVEGGGEAVAGELRAVGGDVATLLLGSDPPATIYLRLASVRELTLLG